VELNRSLASAEGDQKILVTYITYAHSSFTKFAFIFLEGGISIAHTLEFSDGLYPIQRILAINWVGM